MNDSIKMFLITLGVGLLCSLIPFGYVSMMFGFPAVLLNSVVLTIIFKYVLNRSDNEKK